MQLSLQGADPVECGSCDAEWQLWCGSSNGGGGGGRVEATTAEVVAAARIPHQ